MLKCQLLISVSVYDVNQSMFWVLHFHIILNYPDVVTVPELSAILLVWDS